MVTPNTFRPRLERFWSVWTLGEHEVELRSLGRSVRLSGAGITARLSALLPALSGRLTAAEVCAALPGEDGTVAGRLIERLSAYGLVSDGGPRLTEAPTSGSPPEWLDALAGLGSAREAQACLGRSSVLACGSDPIAEILIRILAVVPIVTRRAGPPASLGSEEGLQEVAGASVVVAFGDSLTDAAFDRLAAACAATGTPWLPIACDGLEAHLGPLVVPGRSACLACYRQRVEAVGESPARLLHAGSRPMPPGAAQVVAGVAAAETVSFLLGPDRAGLVDRILKISLRTLAWTRADVLRLPRCPACVPVFRKAGSA